MSLTCLIYCSHQFRLKNNSAALENEGAHHTNLTLVHTFNITNKQHNKRNCIKVKLINLRSRHITGHPNMRVKHCAYGHSTATLLNPRSVTKVSHKYSLTDARHATLVVAAPSTVHYPTNYKIKIYYFNEY
jgi:hypothetical protein